MIQKAVRGAIGVEHNTEAAILDATREMVSQAMAVNRLARESVVSILFAATPDIDAVFPARAVREMGWTDVPLIDAVSPNIKGAMPLVIRMLMTCNLPANRQEITHVYLGRAQRLRPDLVKDARRGIQ